MSRILKNSTIYGVGNIFNKMVGFIMLPIYTNYLTPSDYGIIALLGFFVLITEQMFTGRLTDVVPNYYHKSSSLKDANTTITSALSFTILITLATTLAVTLASGGISNLIFKSFDYSIIICMYSFVLLSSTLEEYCSIYLRLTDKPILFVSFSISKLAIALTLNLVLLVKYELGVLGVAISALATSLIIGTIQIIYLMNKIGFGFNKNVAVEMLKDAFPLWFSGIAGIYMWSASKLFLNEFATLDDVGIFELASKFSNLLMIFIWYPFFQVWQTERFKIHYENKEISETVGMINGTIFVLLCWGVVGISIASPVIIEIMSAESYSRTGYVIPILTLGVMFAALQELYNKDFFIYKKTKQLAYLTYVAAFNVTALNFVLIPKYHLLGATIALTATQFIHLIATLALVKKESIKTNSYILTIGVTIPLLILSFSFATAITSSAIVPLIVLCIGICLFATGAYALILKRIGTLKLETLKTKGIPV